MPGHDSGVARSIRNVVEPRNTPGKKTLASPDIGWAKVDAVAFVHPLCSESFAGTEVIRYHWRHFQNAIK